MGGKHRQDTDTVTTQENSVKMNPQVKAKWVAALRSGEYKQGRRQLRTKNNRFCCLGVLCNIHAQEHPRIAAEQKSPTLYMGVCGTLPAEVVEWAVMPAYIEGQLVDMNDLSKMNFKQIADWVEKNL